MSKENNGNNQVLEWSGVEKNAQVIKLEKRDWSSAHIIQLNRYDIKDSSDELKKELIEFFNSGKYLDPSDEIFQQWSFAPWFKLRLLLNTESMELQFYHGGMVKVSFKDKYGYILGKGETIKQKTLELLTDKSAYSEPFFSLIRKLKEQNGLWVNGITPMISLPETASYKSVMSEYFQSVNYDEGKVKDFEILATQQVVIDFKSYVALHIKSKRGERIFILEYLEKSKDWWVKEFGIL